jgi:hypothetical protein
MHDRVGGQFLQGPQVMTECLFDEPTLFDARRANVLVEQFTGRPGHDGRDLCVAFHGLKRSKMFHEYSTFL